MVEHTETIVVRTGDGTELVGEISAGSTEPVRMPYFDRMRTAEELADLHAQYPGTQRFSPILFGTREYVDTGQRDAHGRRIFA